jgi:hypothetical protein
MGAMVVMVDGAVLGAEAMGKQMSVGVSVPRFSIVDELGRLGAWSHVRVRTLASAVAASQPLSVRGPALTSTPQTPGITVGRANLGQRQLTQRQDSLSAAEGWIRSLGLLPADTPIKGQGLFTHYLNRRLWELTIKYDDVKYSQQARDPTQGTTDCSGWIKFANTTICKDLASELGTALLPKDFLAGFNNVAADQVKAFADRGETLLTGDTLDWTKLVPGMIVAMNYSNNDPDRYKQIDHTTQVMFDPATAEPYITHSSFAGKGVNTHPLGKWFTGLANKETVGKKKLFAIDPYASVRAGIDQWISANP